MSIIVLVLSMERVSSPLIAIGKAQVAATTFFTIIDAPKSETGSLKAPFVTAIENIIFRDCTFAYPGRPSKKVLDNMNLTIEAGKVTAIVGPSGSGKSTIVALLERWYSLHDQVGIAKVTEKQNNKRKKEKESEGADEEDEPVDLALDDNGPPVQLSGSISTCGHELDEIDPKWWRSQIGLVQQEPFLFNDTIFSNVAYGLVGTDFENESEGKKRELVAEACKEAFADEFIDRLPEGYDTVVGDSGAKLSGTLIFLDSRRCHRFCIYKSA
jgi:ATP-binding cassette, subfamily B (MDR/TAP), member 1